MMPSSQSSEMHFEAGQTLRFTNGLEEVKSSVYSKRIE